VTQKVSKERQEAQLARQQRQELKGELAEQYARRPRNPATRRRAITLLIIGVIAALAAIFGALVLLPSPVQQPAAGVPVGAAAPDFRLPVYGGPGIGNEISLRSLHGHPVLLNFWSENCAPCLAEVPYLERVYKQYGAQGQFTLLGVNQADPKDDIRVFGQRYGLTYPLLFDPGGAVSKQYSVTAIPTTYFLDSHGVVRSVFIQPLMPATMKQGLASVGITIP
jgi:cytochrome c biogenesis protein CcmG, thiol:disulfide interchange protein DsbE